VDDGSSDRTAEAAERSGAIGIRHLENLGKGGALKTGFARVLADGFDAVITLDADGQHDPSEIPRFLRASEGGAHVVVGCRMDDVSTMPWIRKWTNQATSAVLSRLAHVRIRDSQSGYRLIRAEVLQDLELVSNRYDLESEILVRAARRGFRIAEVPIRTIYAGGPSSIRPGVDALRFVRLVLRLL
jgi:glycosyltransferase involved in cell wall biosynthesis